MKKRLRQSAVKPVVKSKIPSRSGVLESLTGSDALSILKILAERDEGLALAREIDAVAGELLGEVNVADVAANVKDEMESLDVEDIFDKSGARRDGHVDPGEPASQMFEEALAPFLQDMERYRTLGLPEQASACCLGILQGIYDFDKNSSTQYKEWAVDAPKEYFGQVTDAWVNIYHGKPPLSKLEGFADRHDGRQAPPTRIRHFFGQESPVLLNDQDGGQWDRLLILKTPIGCEWSLSTMRWSN
jgi:hypothetical protein